MPRTAAPVGSPNTLLRTKLYRPSPSRHAIPRARLLQRLQAGLGAGLTLLCAPAGFGKTTLLAQWLTTRHDPSAWLSLDEDDNELRLFVHVLVAALQRVWPDAFLSSATLFQAAHFPSTERVASLLLDDLADVPDDVVLVLDDYHFIHNPEVHRWLETLIEQQPAHLHLVLASRTEPALPLARWRTRGALNELRDPDLRLTRQETHAFLAGVLGEDVAQQTASALSALTQGWVALLQLAVCSLRTTSEPASFLHRLPRGADPLLSDYLGEEVLDSLAPAVQQVLECSALLEPFNAHVCSALLDREVSPEQVQAILQELERSNLFLVPLEERQGWYRLHQLFQPVLQRRLQAHSSPEEVGMLHRRASRWYAEQGLIEEAIQHALAAGDGAGTARLVEAHFWSAFKQERWGSLERWLALIPEEQLQASPVLLFAQAWVCMASGRLGEMAGALAAAQRLVASSDSNMHALSDPPSRLLHALIALGWSYFHYYRGQMQLSLQQAQSALAWTPPGEEYVASTIRMLLAIAQQASGQQEEAIVVLQQAFTNLPPHRAARGRLLQARQFISLAAGQLGHVEQSARDLLRLRRETDLALSRYWAHWALGVVSYERNELEAAVYHFSAVLANRHQAHYWAVQDALCGLAFTSQAQGSARQAHESRDALLSWMQQQHNLPQLMTAYAFCGQLALVQERGEEAQQWLELAGKPEGLGPMMFVVDPTITHAWMLLAKGDEQSVAAGQALLAHLLQHVQTIHSTRKTIQVLALQAWADDVQGRKSEALAVLERALALGHPTGFIRTFADLPRLAPLLQELRKRGRAQPNGDEGLDGYLQRILAAMNPMAARAASTQELRRREGLEALSERELHILHLLGKELTNKEIAHELAITPDTVKRHTQHIYRKLDVNNRRAAVTLARALGLLASDKALTPRLR